MSFFCIWFTGKPGAGKTTIANELAHQLRYSLAYSTVSVLDGDVWRKSVAHDLGFSKEDRDENIRRAGAVAAYLVRGRQEVVVCAFVSPHEEARNYVRELVGDKFLLVEVHAPTELCIQRDPKGMYAKALAGEIKDFTGVQAPYNRPLEPDVILDTQSATEIGSVDEIIAYLRVKGWL